MRIILLPFILASGVSLPGQISLTRANLPKAGDSVVFQDADSSYVAGLDLSQTGGGQVWDFSDMPGVGRPDTMYFVDPAGTAFAGNFPAANLAVSANPDSAGAGVIYFQVGEDAFATLGSQNTALLMRNLTPEQQLILPFTETSTIDQTFLRFRDAGTFQDTGTVAQQVNVDAWGEVITPLGRFDCLRVKRLRQESFKTFGLPVEVENVIYEFWTSEYITPVFTLDYQKATLFGGVDELLSGQVLLAQDILNAAGDLPAPDYAAAVSPNPASGACHVSFTLSVGRRVSIDLFDAGGRAVRRLDLGERPAGAHRQTVDLAGLPPGVYRLSLRVGDRRGKGLAVVVE